MDVDIEQQHNKENIQLFSKRAEPMLGGVVIAGVNRMKRDGQLVDPKKDVADFHALTDSVTKGVDEHVVNFTTGTRNDGMVDPYEIEVVDGVIKVKLQWDLYTRIERGIDRPDDFEAVKNAYLKIDDELYKLRTGDTRSEKSTEDDSATIADNLTNLVATKLRSTKEERFIKRPDEKKIRYDYANANIIQDVRDGQIEFLLSNEIDGVKVDTDQENKRVSISLNRDLYARLKKSPVPNEDWLTLRDLIGRIDQESRSFE